MKFWILIIIGVLIMAMQAKSSPESNKFYNSETRYSSSFADTVKIIQTYLTTKRTDPVPEQPILVHTVAPETWHEESGNHLYRIGHSSVLMQIDQTKILTDPVFSERASPVQWAGPKRFHPAPISESDLPFIDVVVISHDHYDHLDKHTIQKIKNKVGTFITPLKVGDHLLKWGVAKEKVVQLDWWQSTLINGIEFVSTPSQHFSGRGLFDRDQTLWSSWAIIGKTQRVFFSGDSGYFSGFKDIGEKYGPFDITLMEAGAYNSMWKTVHMMPEESIQAHQDVRGKVMVPIHNSTFDLAMHAWYEPLEQITTLAKERDITVLTPAFGQKIMMDSPISATQWWQPNIEEASLDLARNEVQPE
ncbi:MBL fold metallo-hydrolase [Vibrio sp. NTOU-M3]|uniref:MBL fold metallo-hydrolase n=1 Tax=Vibrio sp. NTOU-M3 TaxID=3234954 RepID=UPI00349FB20D